MIESCETLKGYDKDDLFLASTYSLTLLRALAIESGLKHILDKEVRVEVPRTHDLSALWKTLPAEWQEKVVRAIPTTPRSQIESTLEKYATASVGLRFLNPQNPFGDMRSDDTRRHAKSLQQLANLLGGKAHPPFEMSHKKRN